MKKQLRTPYFETGVKCYIYGQDEIEYAKKCEEFSIKYDIDVLFISSYMNIKSISEQFPHLFVISPFVDNIKPGRGMGMVLPEAIKAAGADGAVINHCEKPVALGDIKGSIDRCREVGLLSFVCANTTDEAMAVAQLHPDIMNPEPTELIGTGVSPDMEYVTKTVTAIKGIDSNIITEIAAGISTPDDVYRYIMSGSHGAGAASGILKSSNPYELLEEMICAVRKAKDDLARDKAD